jgi:alcohol dehydrogenase
MGAKTCLLVVDPEVAKLGISDKALESLKKRGIGTEVFTDVDPEPYLDSADKAAELGRETGADLVIGIGGGSAMDTAKAAAALVGNKGEAAQYVGLNLLPEPGLPTVMIPTTAGTGAEVTFTAVFTNRQTNAKGGINSEHMFPDCAILDPELTVSMPPNVTAATGMDALTHAIESYTSRSSTVFTEALALQAIRLIGENLRRAVFNGDNPHARESMLMGSLLAGAALADAGVGACHALAYPLGGNYRISHGLANAVLVANVMEFNLPAAQRRFAAIARSLGETMPGLSERSLAQRAVEAVRTLSRDIGIPGSLQDLGIPRSDIPTLVEGALKVARPVENNPRVLTPEDAVQIYEKTF